MVVKLDAVEAAPLDPDPEADAPFSPVMLEPGSEVEGFLRGSVLLAGPAALRLPALLVMEEIEEDDGMVKTRRKTLLQSRRTLEMIALLGLCPPIFGGPHRFDCPCFYVLLLFKTTKVTSY